MIDIGKVQEKNRLAKALVDQKIAASFEDAVRQIEAHGFTAVEGEQHLQKKEGDKSEEERKQEVIQNDEVKVLKNQLERLSNKFHELSSFIDKYRRLTDNNLKELD